MQTLGLASEPQASDGLIKRLFWPTIQNQYDVDLVGRQGFWLCIAVAILSACLLSLKGHPLLAALVALTYFLGAAGVRERSVAAASLIFLCYFSMQMLNLEAMFVSGKTGNPLLGFVAMMLLFSNVRATFLTRRWQAADPAVALEERPERSTYLIRDKIANQMPPMIWPAAKYVFYPAASVVLLLSLLASVGIAKSHNEVSDEGNADTTRQIQVAPPQ